MTEKRSTKTIIGLIIAGVLSLIVALGALGYFQFYQTADNLYKQDKIFGEVPMKDEETVAVKITYTQAKSIGSVKESGTDLYFISFFNFDTCITEIIRIYS